MNKCYLGVDIGSISTKGVVIDEKFNILSSNYIWTLGNPIEAVKKLVSMMVSKETEFITLIYGDSITEEKAEEAHRLRDCDGAVAAGAVAGGSGDAVAAEAVWQTLYCYHPRP